MKHFKTAVIYLSLFIIEKDVEIFVEILKKKLYIKPAKTIKK